MMRTAVLLAGLLASPALAAVTIDGVSVDFETIGEGFSRPVEAVPLPGDGRLLVVEKTGTIRFLADGQPGEVFLDLSEHEIIYCYELAASMYNLYFGTEEDP